MKPTTIILDGVMLKVGHVKGLRRPGMMYFTRDVYGMPVSRAALQRLRNALNKALSEK